MSQVDVMTMLLQVRGVELQKSEVLVHHDKLQKSTSVPGYGYPCLSWPLNNCIHAQLHTHQMSLCMYT